MRPIGIASGWPATSRCSRPSNSSSRRSRRSRRSGAIGSSLQAELTIRAAADKYRLLASLGDDLKFIFITSQAEVLEVPDEAGEAVVVTASGAPKCERCWHYRADVGHDASYPTICGRCTSNLHGAGEARSFA